MTDRYATVSDFLVRQTGVAAAKITREARLTEDLGIAGDDLTEAMDSFFEEFDVDPGAYAHSTYVGAEGLALFGLGSKKEPTKPLRVATLVRSLEQGHWSD